MNLRSSNPALSDKVFGPQHYVATSNGAMTVAGTAQKSAILIGCCLLTTMFTWQQFTAGHSVVGWMIFGAVGGLIVAIVTCFKQELSPITAPIYALLEGFFLGGLSAQVNAVYPGLPIQAVLLTMGTAGVILYGFTNGYLTVTDKLRSVVIAATAGIFVVYLLSFVLGLFGANIPFIHGNGIIGIGFSLLVIGIASLNLLMDYDQISRQAQNGAPSYMEWYGAFAFMVTIIWLYVEFLRLLMKLRSRN